MTGLAHKLKLALIPTAALAALAIGAPAASAGLLVSSAQSCASEQFSQPFGKWGDKANYTPVPGGAFESGQKAWTLSGGAKVATGNESYKVRSSTDSQSLYIPAGGVA